MLEQLTRALREAQVEDLIGLKVQASFNNPARLRIDIADIARLLKAAHTSTSRDREYFRIFDREKELEALLGELESQ